MHEKNKNGGMLRGSAGRGPGETLSERAAGSNAGNARPDPASRPVPLSRAWLAGYAAVLAYGSLLPFDFARPPAGTLSDLFLWHPAPLDDVVVNLLAYVPLGALVALSRTGRTAFALRDVAAAVLLGATVSLSCELAQTVVVSRVASLLDVLLNVIGCAAGFLAGSRFRRAEDSTLTPGEPGVLPQPDLREATSRPAEGRFTVHRLRSAPFEKGLVVLTLGLVLHSLAPLELVTSTEGLHAGFARADLTLWPQPGWREADAPGWPVGDWIGVGWFVVLGAVAGLAARGAGRGRWGGLGSAFVHGLVVAVVMELGQTFSQSQALELCFLPGRLAGVGLGGWIGALVIPGDIARVRASFRRVPSAALAAAVLVQAALVLWASVGGAGLDPAAIDGRRAASLPAQGVALPFVSAWRQPLGGAGYDILGQVLGYGVSAWLLAALMRRTRSFGPGSVVLLAVWLSLVAEGIRMVAAPGGADATGPVIACVAAFFVSRRAAPEFDRRRPTAARPYAAQASSRPCNS